MEISRMVRTRQRKMVTSRAPKTAQFFDAVSAWVVGNGHSTAIDETVFVKRRARTPQNPADSRLAQQKSGCGASDTVFLCHHGKEDQEVQVELS